MKWLAIALGGAAGSILRYAIYLLTTNWQDQRALAGRVPAWMPTAFPLGTFAVNIIGAFLIGLLWAWQHESGLANANGSSSSAWSPEIRALVFTGLLGGFTTFSTFSLEGAQLFRGGEPSLAGVYLVGSLVLGLAAAFAGMAFGRMAAA